MSRPRGSRPIIYLVARREILMRVRSRVFTVGTIAMIGLIALAIAGASLLAGTSTAVRVGFAGGRRRSSRRLRQRPQPWGQRSPSARSPM